MSSRFGAQAAVERAERVLDGKYDLLGYRGVAIGSPPDWHLDAVHGRTAPLAFWSAVPYLDPSIGDHKIIWELNRHQHFLALGRAHALTRDDRYYHEFVDQLTHWIRSNPPLVGINWASMLELGLRCLSWLWALHFFAPLASRQDSDAWIVDLLLALDRQLRHVDQNLSRYFSPNTHLTGEALALYVAGSALPELSSSERYRRSGGMVLVEEAHRQILPDGGHAERSAHYHRYSTDFYLLALNVARLTRDSREIEFQETAKRQAAFLRAIADDLGRLPLLGDDDGGQLFPICGRPSADATDTLATAAVLLDDPGLLVGDPPEETYWICGTTTPRAVGTVSPGRARSTAFENTGYYVLRSPLGDHLVFDAGRHGYLNGGHAHADALSIVLTIGNLPLIVDPGTGTYTIDANARDRFRSSPMHNTMVVNRRGQSQPRGPFHWQSTADAWKTVWQPGEKADYVEGAHAAYRPLVHVRAITALHGLGWVIVDHLVHAGGRGRRASACAMWHFHPDWSVQRGRARALQLSHYAGAAASISASTALRQIAVGGMDQYAPEYGRVERTLCFGAEVVGTAPFSMCTFVAAQGALCDVTALEVAELPEEDRHGAAFRIDTPGGSLVLLSSVELAPSPRVTAQLHGRLWGTAEYQTTARAAVFQLTAAGPREFCRVEPGLASSVPSARD